MGASIIPISVIITTHNRQNLLPAAIESVMGQEPCDARLETIVVDDNSSDDTPGVVSRYPGVRYIRTKQGTCAGTRNVGIAAASGDWLAFLDDDDAWLPNKIARCCAEMQAHPNARMICSSAYNCDAKLTPGSIWSCPDLVRAWSPAEAFIVNLPPSPSVLLHREVIEKVGLFDTQVTRAEDRDMWLRILAAGFECAAISEPLVLVRNRAQRDGELLLTSCRDTIAVIKHFTAVHGATHLPRLRRWRLCHRVRGWYAHELLQAASEAKRRGDHQNAQRFSRAAFYTSAMHWMRHIAITRR